MSTFNFQGKKSTNYFEGWYIRILDANNNINYAVIFAVTFYEKDPHAFIQIFDQNKQTNTYLRYDVQSFKANDKEVFIEENRLSVHALKIKSKDYDIDITMTDHDLLNQKSAMGFLEKMPLECYQEVLYLNAIAKGTIKSFDTLTSIDGFSYMEKTYGKNFPRRWFWLQAYNQENAFSFTLAGGSVPTLFFYKFGFFIIIKYLGKEYAFGTYNFARLKVSKQGDHVYFTIKKGAYKVMITALSKDAVVLVGPSKGGNMNLDVLESIDSHMSIKFYKQKNLIYEGDFTHSGFEWMYEK